MAGRNSDQATHMLEDGEILGSSVPSSSNSAPIKHNRYPDLQQVTAEGHIQTTDSQDLTDLQPSQVDGNTSPLLQKKLRGSASFLQVLQTAKEQTQLISDMVFPLKQVTLFQGKPLISFNTQEQSELRAGLKFVLVGKFTHGRPPMAAIQKFFAGLKLKGKINLSLMDKKHIFIECICKADFYYLWLKLRWSVLGFTMRIFKWDLEFVPYKESSIAPVWIRLANLPLYFFEVKTLLSIANVIGCPIQIDPCNVNRTNLGVARVCVELDVAKPLIDSIWINLVDDSSLRVGGFWVHISYDVVPAFCLECFHIEHDRDICKRVMDEKQPVNTFKESPVQSKESVPQQVAHKQQSTPACRSQIVSISGTVSASPVAADPKHANQNCAAPESMIVAGGIQNTPGYSESELDIGTVASRGDQSDPMQSKVVVQQVNGAVEAKVEQAVVVQPVVEVLQLRTDAAETEVQTTEVQPVVEVLQQGSDAAETSTAGTDEAETAIAVLDVAQPAVTEVTGTTPQHLQDGKAPQQLHVSAQPFFPRKQQQAISDLASALPVTTSPSVQQADGSQSQPVASPITVHCSTKLNSIRSKLPQVWQKVKCKSPVKIQAETASVIGNSVPTSNRFSVIAAAVPALTEAPVGSSVEKTGVQLATTTTEFISATAQNTPTVPAEDTPRNVTTTTNTTTTPASPVVDMQQSVQTMTTVSPQERTRRRTDIENVQQGNWVSAVRQNSVTTRAQARKLAPEQHNQQQFEKASTRKAKEQMQNKNLNQSVQVISQNRNESEKTSQESIEENFKRYQYSPMKPKRTKEGCPVVVFKQDDVDKWLARQKEREQDQMRAQGLPFDDKG